MLCLHVLELEAHMKLGKWPSRATLSLFFSMFLLGAAALVQAQDQRDEDKPAQPEASQPQDEHSSSADKDAKPSKQDDAKPSNQEENKQDTNNPARNEDKTSGQEDVRSQAGQNGNARESGQSGNQQSAEHMQANANGNQRGGHIPDDKFRASFGRQHTFAMQQPTAVQGQPTFQYGGYSFALVDAWPAGWAYTDQCYIDYIDGEYFLFDLVHPGVRLAIVVVL
jgi:hypothetical protein